MPSPCVRHARRSIDLGLTASRCSARPEAGSVRRLCAGQLVPHHSKDLVTHCQSLFSRQAPEHPRRSAVRQAIGIARGYVEGVEWPGDLPQLLECSIMADARDSAACARSRSAWLSQSPARFGIPQLPCHSPPGPTTHRTSRPSPRPPPPAWTAPALPRPRRPPRPGRRPAT